MDEIGIKELSERFLKAIPPRQFFDLEELKRVVGKEIKEVRKKKISGTEFCEIVAHLLKNRLLTCRVYWPRGTEIKIADGQIFIDNKAVTDIFRPTD